MKSKVLRRGAAAVLATGAALAAATADAGAAECPNADAGAHGLPQFLSRALCLDARISSSTAEMRRAAGAQQEAEAANAWQMQLLATPSLATQTGSGGGRQTSTLDTQWQAQRTLHDGGQRHALVDQRTREKQATLEDAQALQQDVLNELVGVWAGAQAARVNLQSTLVRLEAASLSVQSVRARLAAGSATQVDLLSATAELAQAEYESLQARQNCALQQGLVASRLGLEKPEAGCPAAPIAEDGETQRLLARWQARALGLAAQVAQPGAPGQLQHPLPDAAAPSCLAEHPQLSASRLRLEARQAAARAALAQDRSSLSVSASLGPNLSRSNASSPTGAHDTRQRFSTGVAMSWSMPLGDGGARQARVAQAQAGADAARAQLDQLSRQLDERVWQAWVRWQSADAALLASQTALASAQAVEAAQQAKYQAGTGTLLDWLRAQTERSARTNQLNTARQSVLINLAGVLHACGRLVLEGQS